MALAGLVALGLIIMLVMRLFGRGLSAAARNGRPSRLGIVDAFDLDRHRQLVIVRRDNVEHLIMIGGPNDLVIESAIERAQPSLAERRDPVVQTAPPMPSGPRPAHPAPAPSAPVASPPPSPPPPPPVAPAFELRPTLDVPEPVPVRPAPVMPRAITPPPLRAPIVPPPPPPPAPAVEPPVAAEKASEPPRLAMNIDSLEEEVSRLLGRPPEKRE